MTAPAAAPDIKAEVRAFYDSVGWQTIGQGLYQNARYEDLRPVSREYIQRCHRRVGRYLPASGRFLLDAGSGPIQYPEYLEYSRGYGRRVCLDISGLALREARMRIGDHGLFVLGDMAAMPFRDGAFEGTVSLHALHHVPPAEQRSALREVARVTASSGSAAVVYSWGDHSGLMAVLRPVIRLANAVRGKLGRRPPAQVAAKPNGLLNTPGSHSHKHDYAWMTAALRAVGRGEIVVWRSVSTELLRTLIHERLMGQGWLRLIYRLEEWAPRWFGRHGMYPLIVLRGGVRAHSQGDAHEVA